MSGTPLKATPMEFGTPREPGHDGRIGRGFSALVCCLFFFVAVVFFAASGVQQLDEAVEDAKLGYRRGPVVRAVFHEASVVQGLVSMRTSASQPHAPTKVVVGLAFQAAAPRGEYTWTVASECSRHAAGATDLTLRHGGLRNDGGLALLVVYDEDLPLAGPNSVIGKQLVLSGPGGAAPICALLGVTTGDGQPISELAGGTRGAACAGERGAVASTNFLATRAGLQVLAEGGNAADAAVAIQLMLGVAQPESNGIGGGCFIVLYNATTKEVQTIDGREEAPSRFHPNVFCLDPACGNDPSCPSCPTGPMGFGERFTGGLAVGVPGTYGAAARLNAEHGTKPMRELAAPAIETARTGITMTNHLYNAIRGSVARLQLWPASEALYLSTDSARAEMRATGRDGDITGVVTLKEISASSTEISYNIQGLVPNSIHGFHIHETADYSNGCLSTGGHYNPQVKTHGAPFAAERHVGDLGNIVADSTGVAGGTITDSVVRLSGAESVMGRAVVLHDGADDLGLGGESDSLTTGHAGGRLMCGTIATKPVADAGEKWFNPDLAATYELLAERGPEEFYSGGLAREIVAAVQNAVNPVSGRGGVMDYADISGFRAVKRAPTHVHFEGPNGEDYELYGMGMPSSGGATMAIIFNLLEEAGKQGDYAPLAFDPSRGVAGATGGTSGGGGGVEEVDEAIAAATNAYDSSTRADYDSGWAEGVEYTTQDLKALADAQNIAFADRNKYMGDADFVDLPMPNSGITGFPEDGGLLAKVYARQRWAEHGGATQEEVPWGVPPDWDGALGAGMLEDDHGTTHFVVVDKDKNVVSWTTTIESNMGSSVVVPGRGFPLNNEMTDFDATAEDADGLPNANAPEGGKRPRRTALIPEERSLLGGKRPRSSMAPTIVLKDGEPFMAIGCPGGSSIIGAVSNALLGRLVHELPIQTAVDLPRIISKNPSNAIEEPMCVQWPDVCAEFQEEYRNTYVSGPGTLVQAAEILPGGGLVAAADTKRIDSGACGAI